MPSRITPANSAAPARVLVVDDDVATAQTIARTVEGQGHAAEIATSWTAAIRAFDSTRTDLVLMDAVMPTVDGFKLTRYLRARATSYVPIVFLTGLTDHPTREQCIAVGADDFLTKPVDALELEVRLTAMLRIRSLTRALEAKTRALSKMARYDALTGVGNRRAFDERLASEVAAARRHRRPVALLMFDLDHFKSVNDDFGHAIGDDLLATFGRLLSDSTRSCDFPCRYGGEEFAVIATETTTRDAFEVGARVRERFRERSRSVPAGGVRTVSVGIGGTDVIDGVIDGDKLKAAADTALYLAKESGRDRVVLYRRGMQLRAS